LPPLTLIALILSLLLSVYTLNMFVMAVLAARTIMGHKQARVAPHLSGQTLPLVTVQIPIYNEGVLVENVLENVAGLDYPKSLLQIQVLDDSTDNETLRKEETLVTHYGDKGYDLQLVHRDTRKGFKAGALNNGLRTARGDYVAVVDADTWAPRNFLLETVSRFGEDDHLAFVQTRCDYTDRWFNWVTESNAIARDVHFLVEQPAKDRYDLLPNFSGKAGMWRREVLDKYGWDESVLTEDVELSYRVLMGGWRSLYLQGITCQIELPPSLTALRTQQRRWTAGFAQSLRKLWRPIITSDELTTGQKLETLLFLSSPLTHLGVLAAIALWILAAILEPQTTLGLWLETLSFSGFITFISTAPHLAVLVAVLQSGGEKRVRKLLTVPLMIVVLTGNLIANAKGAIEGLTKDNLIFERTVKHGKNLGKKKHEIKADYGLVGLVRKNRAEMCAAALGLAATCVVLLQGQATSAVPLFYLAAVWFITSVRD
jgi:cellulose synthase/poly-beta-1,6-N-acetylglucosamine synthase-like glycosyltransferase